MSMALKLPSHGQQICPPGFNEQTEDPSTRRAGWSHNWQSRLSHELGRKPLSTVPCSWQATPMGGLRLAVPSGYLLDRFNSQRVLVATTLGIAVTTGSFVWAHSVVTMIVLMFLQGLFQMWVWLILQAMISRAGTGPAAIQQLTLFSLAWGIGLAAGPSVGAWVYDIWGFNTVSASCGLFSLVGTVGALLVPPVLRHAARHADDVEGSEPQKGIRGALRRSFGSSVVIGVMVSSFVNLYVQSLRLSFYPLFLQQGEFRSVRSDCCCRRSACRHWPFDSSCPQSSGTLGW